ncbi:MAG: YidC/Oxa1 family membrane protein insertase [Erysipelotrichaceae bacterium]|nr:YidC/Oxa1 family membrane protein insertase [Erysipelotrichaceae bacterium]
MTFFSALSTILISPLKLLFEAIFQIAYELTRNPGVSIIFLSLAMNLLVLPLYKRADAMQESARDAEEALREGTEHIKKTFTGNERMMMLQTYYRQNNYSPFNAVKGSVSLLLEIPFFMAAYQFLSNLEILKGTAFGPISDLSLPDGLINIGGTNVNVLPILMTAINYLSAALYLKGVPLKTKIQTYGIAAVFLVLLYGSPSGLVFYWTLNNVFSLLKNLVRRLFGGHESTSKGNEKPSAEEPDSKLFLLETVFMTLLVGLLIPSTYIAASPQEYVDISNYFNPLWYLCSSFCLALGFFVFWFGVFYRLAGNRGKVIFEKIMLAVCVTSAINYLFFGTSLGIVSSVLRYGGGLQFGRMEKIINTTVCVLLSIALIVFHGRIRNLGRKALLVAACALTVMSGINVATSASSLARVTPQQQTSSGPHFTLSQKGKNVVVLFLDRAMGEYVPYLINEKPELKTLYDGFTYYSNVISHGGHTNMGAPGLMGGYEYTPVEMNRRSEELLKDKHNEALKVMPVLFDRNGFNVTVCDAPYANYEWIPDLSIYDDYPRINTYLTKGYFGDTGSFEQVKENNLRNFFCFSLMKTWPVLLQPFLYDGGSYLRAGAASNGAYQISIGTSRATGISQAFMEAFDVLRNLDRMTTVSEGSDNNYLFLYNDAPHETMLFSEPDYQPSVHVDNTEFDKQHADRFKLDGRSLSIYNGEQMSHYQTNMAVLLQIGEWLNYLREKGVYDNTRIIIVADHGYYLYQSDELQFRRGGRTLDMDSFFPLLMVKDFDSRGFTVSDEFMTNADVPSLAVEGLIVDPVNPFTGKRITMEEKTAHDQFIITSRDWDVATNHGNTFAPATWAAISGNIWDRSDWQFIDEKTVLKEHVMP